MSGPYKNNDGYSASDIEKYWKGELSAREMHDLEQAALDDPFLSDAMEGMALHRSPPCEQDLDELRQRLKARIAAKKRQTNLILAPWTKIAAAILLLVGLGFAAYYSFLPTRSTALAKNGDSSSKTATLTPAAPTHSDLADSTSIAIAPPGPVASSRAIGRKSKKTVTTPDQAQTQLAAAPTVNHDTLKFTSGQPDLAKALGNADYRQLAFDRQRANPVVLRGKVLDEHDNPLPGAYLSLNDNKRTGAVTNQQGYFSIKLRPQDSTGQLMVGLNGYEQTSLALNTLSIDNHAMTIIRLQHHPTLDEVVVSGFGSRRKEALATAPADSDDKLDSLWQKATPVVGREAYLQYLTTAKKTLALDSTITGTESLSFEVDKNGVLDSFKIEQSLSPAHDAGIIRLVKEGPAWKLLAHRKTRAVVKMAF
jgi:hypothetical protein